MAKSKKQKFYVVWEGNEPGIYTSWAACQAQIKGFSGARYKAFPSMEQAEQAFFGDSSDFIGKNAKPVSSLTKEDLERIGKPNYHSISVDAACSGNPGALEYQGVDTKTGMRLFHKGPFPYGTVNLGEFLALVHGLALLKKQGKHDIPIYSDSRTAMAWVRNKKVRTEMKRNRTNAYLFQLVDRAEQWLHQNTFRNPILKWETKAWGEIPADFGRK